MLTGFNWHFHAYRRFRNDLPDSRRHFKTERAFGSRSPDHGHCIDFGGKSGFWSKYKFITTTDYSPAGCETPVENVRISEELTVNNSVATTPAAFGRRFRLRLYHAISRLLNVHSGCWNPSDAAPGEKANTALPAPTPLLCLMRTVWKMVAACRFLYC